MRLLVFIFIDFYFFGSYYVENLELSTMSQLMRTVLVARNVTTALTRVR